jgi:hypothetical protein
MPLFRINNVLIYFIHVPKTGGSSIQAHLSKFGRPALITSNDHSWPKNNAQHMASPDYTRILPRDFYDYGFTVVRNPFDRIVSEYRMRCGDQTARSRPIKDFPEWVEGTFRRYRRDCYLLDNHIRPQADFLSEGVEVFKLEDGLQRVLERLGVVLGISLGTELPRLKASGPIDLKVSDECAAQISSFYEIDFRKFGYDDDPQYLLRKEGTVSGRRASKYARTIRYYARKFAARSM